MSSLITIPLSRLSLDPQQRHAQLRDYFCDKDAVATQVGDQWALVLGWSDDPYRYVDPQLDEGLAWWGSNLRYQDMALARKRRGRLLLSLNDTWTLESWSEWLARTPSTRTSRYYTWMITKIWVPPEFSNTRTAGLIPSKGKP